jgi:hypothetical protein
MNRIQFPLGPGIFSLPHTPALGLTVSMVSFFLWVKQLVCKAYHLRLSVVEVKSEWSFACDV